MLRHIFCTLLAALSLSLHAQQIGTWTNYMAYAEVQEIANAGNYMFVRASNGVYKYNKNDQSITTYDKLNGLSDTYITLIKWNATAKRLIAVYEDSNIDLIDTDDNIQNVADLYNKTMTESKTVYHIYIYDRWAFLATGFGVVRVNMRDGNISETCNLGFRVNHCYVEDGCIYAVSGPMGKYRASLSSNIQDKAQWTKVGGYTAPVEEATDSTLLATAKSLQPDGPHSNDFYFLNYTDGKLYTAGGTYAAGVETSTIGTVQVLADGQWQNYEQDLKEKTGFNYIDAECVAIDPTTKSSTRAFVGARSGLYEFENGVYKQYFNKDNSPLQGAMDRGKELGNTYCLVEGLIFDSEGSLWVLNSQAKDKSLLEYTKDGQWVDHHKAAFMQNDGTSSFRHMVRPIFDSRGLLWFACEHSFCPYLVQYNKETDEAKVYTSFTNTDGTRQTIIFVACVKEDAEGNIWVGTNAGPFYLTPSDISSGSDIFTQYKVARNDGTGLADYLLSGVYIKDIAIDGGNRKWFATSGDGVYLISSDNDTQIAHFTTSNSGLLSDNVSSITINGTTGEVFFATDKGLCSYKSDATTPNTEMTKDNVYAYPNPVEPGYTGLITIVGLTADADVKVATATGYVVAEGRSNGGTFTWDGCDKQGRRVASGIYNVMTATSDGSKGTVCKVAIVR